MPRPTSTQRILIATTTALALSAGALIAPAQAASKSGSLNCGTRFLAAKATGYKYVKATAAGKVNEGYTDHASGTTVTVVSGSNSGSWSGYADQYLQSASGYCYG